MSPRGLNELRGAERSDEPAGKVIGYKRRARGSTWSEGVECRVLTTGENFKRQPNGSRAFSFSLGPSLVGLLFVLVWQAQDLASNLSSEVPGLNRGPPVSCVRSGGGREIRAKRGVCSPRDHCSRLSTAGLAGEVRSACCFSFHAPLTARLSFRPVCDRAAELLGILINQGGRGEKSLLELVAW